MGGNERILLVTLVTTFSVYVVLVITSVKTPGPVGASGNCASNGASNFDTSSGFETVTLRSVPSLLDDDSLAPEVKYG